MLPPNCAGCDHLRDVFGHMALSDQGIVALSGGHTLVTMFSDFSVYHSIWP